MKNAETTQTEVWKGEFGRSYTDRNTLAPTDVDALYRKNYGLSRTEINQSFLQELPPATSFLEVGCNTGNQLLLLQEMGFSNLSGVEVQPYALEIAESRLRNIALKAASALSLPFADQSFDVVFTSGVLIHIAPEDIPRAMDEIYRCAKTFIWGLEYYAPSLTEVNYRSHSRLLWKMDFAKGYLERFPDLELVREQRLPYLDSPNADAVFLLKKTY